MFDARGALEVETLLKIVLVLVAVWFVLSLVETVLSFTLGLFSFLQPLLGVALLVLVVLWLVDRI